MHAGSVEYFTSENNESKQWPFRSAIQGCCLGLTKTGALRLSVSEQTDLAKWLSKSPGCFRVGPQEPLLATVKRRKLAWLGNVTSNDSLSKTIHQGTSPWSAEEMLEEQHPRMDTTAHARTAHKGFLQKRLEEDLCWIVLHIPPTTQWVKGLNRTELIICELLRTRWSFNGGVQACGLGNISRQALRNVFRTIFVGLSFVLFSCFPFLPLPTLQYSWHEPARD